MRRVVMFVGPGRPKVMDATGPPTSSEPEAIPSDLEPEPSRDLASNVPIQSLTPSGPEGQAQAAQP